MRSGRLVQALPQPADARAIADEVFTMLNEQAPQCTTDVVKARGRQFRASAARATDTATIGSDIAWVSARTSASVTPDHPGNAAPTETPTDCFVTASPKASPSPITHRHTSLPSNRAQSRPAGSSKTVAPLSYSPPC